MLTTLNEILGKAKREGYGVAAPDAYSSSSVMVLYYLVAKNGSEIVFGAWFHRLWINERLVLFLHASLDIEPCLRHLAFADIYFVRYFLFHNDHLLYYS